MGIKERRTKILLALYFLSDTTFKDITFDERVQKIFDLSLNQKTKATFKKLTEEGSIEKASTNTSASGKKIEAYKLTDKGFHSLAMEFPFCRFMRDTWDQKWRILSYEIPESKRELRDKLRREVAAWGLGPWHRSFWVTPHPIIENLRELVQKTEEEQYIQAFEADHVFGDKNILIEKVWNKSTLEKNYRDIFKKWHEILSLEIDKTQKLTKIVAIYVDILRNDPGLPKDLVGESWIGFEAYNIFKEIRNILLS